MTVSNITNRASYTGDGVTTVFNVPYYFIQNADLVVTDNGNVKVLGTDYTVSGAGNPSGGQVTFTVAPALNDKVVIRNIPAQSQLINFVDNVTVLGSNITSALDKLTILIQYLQDQLSGVMQENTLVTIGAWLGNGLEIQNIAPGASSTSAATVGQIQGIVAAAGSVPPPVLGNVGQVLMATAVGIFSWQPTAQVYFGGTASGTGTAYTLGAIANFALNNGNVLIWFPNTDGTGGPTTLVANSLAAKNIKVRTASGLVDPQLGDIKSGQAAIVIYDNTQYELINPADTYSFENMINIASAATTDLGAAADAPDTHFANITGTTTITSFGSSASLAAPFYWVQFAGNLQITPSANILTPGGFPINTTAGDLAFMLYLGSGKWLFLDYFSSVATGPAISGAGALPGANNLKITNDGTTPNTKLDITADYAWLTNTIGSGVGFKSINLVLNAGVTGIDGLDTGALGVSQQYYVYLISNGSVVHSLLSLSSTAPTLPAGYTYFYRIGACNTDSGSIFFRFVQRGDNVQYMLVTATNTAVFPLAKSAAQSTNGSFSVASWVPPTAKSVKMTGNPNAANFWLLGPNALVASFAVGDNNMIAMNVIGGDVSTDIQFETAQTIFYATGATASTTHFNVIGYRDAVNCN